MFPLLCTLSKAVKIKSATIVPFSLKKIFQIKISCWLIGWLGPRQYVEQHLQDLLSGQHSVRAVHHELPPPFSGEITTGILHLKQLYNYICYLQPGDSFNSESFIGFISKIAIITFSKAPFIKIIFPKFINFIQCSVATS